jgi:hypothetical protein
MVEQPHLELFNALATPLRKRNWSSGRAGTLKRRASRFTSFSVFSAIPIFELWFCKATAKLTKLFVREVQSHFNGTNPKSESARTVRQLLRSWVRKCRRVHGCPARTRKHLKEATVTAASPRAVTTGQHYDLIVAFDDLVTAVNYRNVELLDKLETDFYHLQPLLDPGGEVIVTGTRYSFADLYARILAKDID